MGKKLRLIGKALEFERITTWIGDEQRRLLACLTSKSSFWRYKKLGIGFFKSIGQRTPTCRIQHDAEMACGN